MRIGLVYGSLILLIALAAAVTAENITAGEVAVWNLSAINESDPVAWFNWGDSLLDQGLYNESIRAYDRAIELNRSYAEAWSHRGNAFYNLGKYDDALQAYNKSIEINPLYSVAWNNKGSALNALKKYNDSLQAYNKSIEINPRYGPAWCNKGNVLDRLGRYNESLQAYNESIEINSQYEDAWAGQGRALLRQGRYAESILASNRALEINPRYEIALSNKGIALEVLGRYNESLQAYETATKIDPNDTVVWNGLGNALAGLGRFDESLQAYDTAIKIDQIYAEPWNNKGFSLYFLGKYNESLLAYKNAIKIDPKYEDAWCNCGITLYALGMYNESLQAYNNSIAINPKAAAWSWSRLGNALYRFGRYAESLQAYNNSIAINPGSSVWNNKGNALSRLERYAESPQAYNNSIAINLGSSVWNNKGNALSRLGRYAESLQAYNNSIAINSENKFAWFNKGRVLYDRGVYSESLQAYNTSTKIDPKFVDAWYGKSYSLQRLDRSADAVIAFAMARDLEWTYEWKLRIFIVSLVIYLSLAIAGYRFSRRRMISNESVAFLTNVLGFLACIILLSGLFDDFKSATIFLAGGFLVAFATCVILASMSLPMATLGLRTFDAFDNFEKRCFAPSRMIKAMSLMAIVSFALIFAFFYIRIGISTESEMLTFLRRAFAWIFIMCLTVSLPSIMGSVMSALLSTNVNQDTRNVLLVIQFGYLGITAMLVSTVLWFWGLSQGLLNASPIFLGIMAFLLVSTFFFPYLSGWQREKKWRELLMKKQQIWIEEVLDILEVPTPALYPSKLQHLCDRIDEVGIVCEETPTIKKTAIFGQDNAPNRFEILYEEDIRRNDPCLSYKNFLKKLHENILECLTLFKSPEENVDLTETARAYAEVYRIRKDEIAKKIVQERETKPLLWIGLAFILTPILVAVLGFLGGQLGPKFVELVPSLMQLGHALSGQASPLAFGGVPVPLLPVSP